MSPSEKGEERMSGSSAGTKKGESVRHRVNCMRVGV